MQDKKSVTFICKILFVILPIFKHLLYTRQLFVTEAFSFHSCNVQSASHNLKVTSSWYKVSCSRSNSVSSLKGQKNQKNRNDSPPGSELFPAAGSSYIPSGLTEKQWNEIKRKERKELEKKDFGAWGPRFARSDRPDGDWMVMPSLWTRGFNSNSIRNGSQKDRNFMSNRNVVGQSKTDATSNNIKNSSSTSKKRLVPIYVMTFLIMEWILATFYSVHKKGYASLFVVAAMKVKKSSVALPWAAFLFQGTMAAKLIMSAMVMQPMQRLVMKIQDRFQWRLKSCMLIVTIASMIISLILSTLVTFLFGTTGVVGV